MIPAARPHIMLLCATQRGVTVLDRLLELAPNASVTAVSFREEAIEPPFLEDVRELAQSHAACFFESKRLDGVEIEAFMQSHSIDVLLAVSWRYRVPASIYRKTRLGSFVFHDSLLPAYRGFSPTVWAMIDGQAETGVTLFEMTEEIDAGDIVGQAAVAIGPDDTIGAVRDRVTQAYLRLLGEHLPEVLRGCAARRPQDHALATHVRKRTEADHAIDWSRSAVAIHNLVRATTAPYPGAFTTLDGQVMRVWATERIGGAARPGHGPGRIAGCRPGGGVVVETGDGVIAVTSVQIQGQPRRPAEDVLNRPGVTLGLSSAG